MKTVGKSSENSTNKIIRDCTFTKKERTITEKKKETRKGGLERFFSIQAALPRLFLGRILPKKAASYQKLTESREPKKVT
jgi:hypothetical protein